MEISLFLDGMDERHPGLTPAVAAYYAEGACVCLSRHHTTPTYFQARADARDYTAYIEWRPADDSAIAAWSNSDDTTRDGAYAVSLATLEVTDGLVATHRAQTRTGADYYVAPSGAGSASLEDAYRLEVSGLDKGDETAINQRLKRKREQTRRGQCNLPAIASIVGFRALVVRIEYVEDT